MVVDTNLGSYNGLANSNLEKYQTPYVGCFKFVWTESLKYQ